MCQEILELYQSDIPMKTRINQHISGYVLIRICFNAELNADTEICTREQAVEGRKSALWL